MRGPGEQLAEQEPDVQPGSLPGPDPPRARDAPAAGPAPREDLRERLERLPAGHPSSPYADDGSPKAPPPDLAEAELPLPDEDGSSPLPPDRPAPEPLTDAEYADHVRQVEQRLAQARADGLATEDRFARDDDKDVWARERSSLHDAILRDLYEDASGVPSEGQAIIAGGLPGAGKSTILGECANVDRSRYFTIDPDQIKAELVRRGLAPTVEGLTPMETADLIHEESSHIAKRLARRAQADKKNVIWDITMSSQRTTERRMEDLRSAGYTRIEGIFVDIPPETSAVRAHQRHRRGLEEFRAGRGDGGRFVGTRVINELADAIWGSVNRKVFESLKQKFDAWAVYDNSLDRRPPLLIDSSERQERSHDR